ncbi:hypothetical protein B7463_g10282, partial [Scytalidium lignicola]
MAAIVELGGKDVINKPEGDPIEEAHYFEEIDDSEDDAEVELNKSSPWRIKELAKLLDATQGVATYASSGDKAYLCRWLNWYWKDNFPPRTYWRSTEGWENLEISGEKYLFVDTPGFGAHDLKDMFVFEDIVGCIAALGPFVTNISFVITKWDALHPDDVTRSRETLKKLKEDYLMPVLEPPSKYIGGCVYNHGIEICGKSNRQLRESTEQGKLQRISKAREFIHRRYSSINATGLQIQEEMIKGTDWRETEAAKVLNSVTEDTRLEIYRNRTLLLGKNDPLPEEEPVVGAPQNLEPSLSDKILEWLNIAKQMSLLFLQLHKEELASSFAVVSSAWERIKNWWSGPPPV